MVRRHKSSAVERYLEHSRRSRASFEGHESPPLYGLPKLLELVPTPPTERADTPDLLHAEPCASIDRAAALKALEFAFAAGDSAGIASGALETAAIAPSEWQPDCFADELFVDELVEGVLRFKVGGKPAPLAKAHLKRLLTEPPLDQATVAMRHDILRELRQDESMRTGLLGTYGHIARLLALMDESANHSRYDLPRWRLDVLEVIRAIFDTLHGPFESANTGLRRLHDFAVLVRDSQGFQELCGLLDFEGDMARVDLHLRIGADGRPRELQIIEHRERRTKPFYRGPLARLIARIGMFLRGYRIGEVDLVERWFDHVYTGVVRFLPAVLQLRGDLEFYLSACHFEKVAADNGLQVCIPELVDDSAGRQKQLQNVFNPLLLLQDDPPIPCSLTIDSFHKSCIVTGPNSGGKTRLLQGLALCQMLGQAGFLVPARSALLRRASGLFVSLGDEPTADQQEGRLGSELIRIRRLFERAPPGSMVLLDELCSGTNPSEGEQIFRLVVDLLRELEPEVYITTHFLQFAAELARDTERHALCFLQVELDSHKLPTFQFIPGVASTSLAKETASRLGVSRDELLALIRRHGRTRKSSH